ncbi:hypothetical protein B0H14DRAFT_2645661 [Mycena olivaceomarginata]|nr:hypothetical protein B0H14DRAFT_2645661 [Mycena olivaceomarginata]
MKVGNEDPKSLTSLQSQKSALLATPALWRAIGLSDANISFSREDRWLKAWLSRSGACPLSIAIDNRGSCIMPETIATAMLVHRARFQQLRLCIHLSSLAKIAEPMPLLHWLDLSVIDRSNSRVVAFRDASLLRTVVLRGFAASIVTLLWDQLTRLTLSGIESEHCVIILEQTTKLIECTVYFKKDHVALEDHLDVVLPCLQSLIVEILAGGMLEVGELFLEADPIQSLKSFVLKSQCKLQEVWITQQRKEHISSVVFAMLKLIFYRLPRGHEPFGFLPVDPRN